MANAIAHRFWIIASVGISLGFAKILHHLIMGYHRLQPV
jgi:hypothetical protein